MPKEAAAENSSARVARRLLLFGRVQGLGVRPAVARLAARLNLAGSVANRLDGVEILVEGSAQQLQAFEGELPAALPAGARMGRLEGSQTSATGRTAFRILEELAAGAIRVFVPCDSAACADCLREVAGGSPLRHGYPFTSCTLCGPRYSIIERMPYERALTSMSAFPLCARCRDEYDNAADRRFHAQTNCCPECGPQVWCGDRTNRLVAARGAALEAAVAAIRQGKIVAVRGLGGYQLVCDATKDEVVQRLRGSKRRSAKPLAVMVESKGAADLIGCAGPEESRALTAPENPIVLLEACPGNGLSRNIHPGLREVGVMLPTTPLHALLASAICRPLVVTSGNTEGAPLAVEPCEAERELAGLADLWLHHSRPIVRPIDDSVVRIIAGRAVTIRCARGLAPLPLALESKAPILAVGGHQKAALALSNGLQSDLGPHVGNLDGVAMQERFVQQVRGFTELYGFAPELIVHDLHPAYFTTRWAQEQPVTRLAVQHHHAHVVSGMIEHGWLDREVLGIAFDGTGFGSDGTIWGGEFLLATARSFERVARLRPFRLPGGEAAIRDPWRIAFELVTEVSGSETALRMFVRRNDREHILAVRHSDRFAPSTSSAGRLFDAVASLVLKIDQVAYEGQAAMLLEASCDHAEEGRYDLPLRDGELIELDWRPMIRQVLDDLALGASPATIAMRFHRGLATAAAAVARRFAACPVVLCGGSFQNRLLTELVLEELKGTRQPVGLPGIIPPNDGGLAAGQLGVALARLATRTFF
jgi:hydrogenase maturation protein HypF